MTLDQVPSGAHVFMDLIILVYQKSGGPPCQTGGPPCQARVGKVEGLASAFAPYSGAGKSLRQNVHNAKP